MDSLHTEMIEVDEPPACSLINAEGQATVLFVADHASATIPRVLNNLGLDEEILGQHVAYDIGTRDVVTKLAQAFNAPAVVANYSRLVVDLNRQLEDPSLMSEVSDGITIPGNQQLSAEMRNQRIHNFYTPYRKAIDQQLHRFRSQGIIPALIAIHSFTPQLAASDTARPWHIGILWDVDPRIPVPLMELLRARPEDICVGDNEPYSGRYPADYTIDHHGEGNGLPHVSIEIRQDLIMSPDGVEHWSHILYESLSQILVDPELYKVLEY